MSLLRAAVRAHKNPAGVEFDDIELRESPLLPQTVKRFGHKDFSTDTEGYTCRNEKGDIVVAFRGSETPFEEDGAWRDWLLTNFRANRVHYEPDPGPWGARRWVHAGFWDALDPVRDNVAKQVQKHLDATNPAGHRIFVTGFSLGGALATLAAVELAQTFPRKEVQLYTFAAPRAGDGTFNKHLIETVDETHVVLLQGDPIPLLPPVGPSLPIDIGATRWGLPFTGIPLSMDELWGMAMPSIGNNYQTPDEVHYLTNRNEFEHGMPGHVQRITVRFGRHSFTRYFNALNAAANLGLKCNALWGSESEKEFVDEEVASVEKARRRSCTVVAMRHLLS
ncbi:MAG: lipase family protein [Acidobacteriota bacterium]